MIVVDAGTGGGSRRSRTLFVLGLLPLPFVPGAEARSPVGAICNAKGILLSLVRKQEIFYMHHETPFPFIICTLQSHENTFFSCD